MWIRSILKDMAGIIRLENPVENRIVITFDDQKTDEKKIAQALFIGGISIQGNPAPMPETPFSYK
jgi:hypothetical protein